jgi:glycosyltransferase involved in cell wall biosynthesis
LSSNGQMRVLQVGKYYPPHKGGMETHLHLLSGELRKALDVKVVVANEGKTHAQTTLDGVSVTRVGTAFHLAGAPICPRMALQIRETGADLVHIHLPNPTAVLAYLLSGRKGRVVATWHSDITRCRGAARMFQPLQGVFLRRCSALIATSPNYVESSPTLSDFRDRCHVIPHGITIEAFRRYDEAQVAAIRARYGPRIVLCVGRLVYYKGIHHVMRAMASVRGKLLVLGDGPLRERLRAEVESPDLADRVVMLGAVADLVPYYQACDVFVLPSVARSEAFGIVQLEAMACGKPVVNTRLESGVPFVSIHGMTGITVAPGDSVALADALNRLLDDPARAAIYGQAGLRRVREEFSVERMASRTLALYSQVAANGNGSKSLNGNRRAAA